MANGHKRAERRLASAQSQRAAVFQPEFVEDLRFRVETNRKIALRVLDLVDSVLRDPFGRTRIEIDPFDLDEPAAAPLAALAEPLR